MRDHSTAIHEAGHAVIGRILAIECGRVSIDPDEECAGHCIIEGPWDIVQRWEGEGYVIRDNELVPTGTRPHGTYQSALRARILTLMAGWAAELVILGDCRGGHGDDWYWIGRILEELPIPGQQEAGNGAWERYEQRMRAKTISLVRRHRAKIEGLARALMSVGSLEPEEIEAILADIGPAAPRIPDQ